MNQIELTDVLECYNFIVETVLKSPQNSNVKYCIVHKNISKYEGYISWFFNKSNISFSKNYDFSLLSDGFCAFVISLIRLIKFDFEISYVIEFFRIVPYIDNEELSILEKYIKIHSVSDISTEFDMSPFLDKDKLNESNICRVKLLNDIRARCMNLINQIKNFAQNQKLCDLILYLSKQFEYDKMNNFNLFSQILVKTNKFCDNIDNFLRIFIDEVSYLSVFNCNNPVWLYEEIDLNCKNCSIFMIMEKDDDYNIDRILLQNNDIFVLLAKNKIRFVSNLFSKEKKYLRSNNIFLKKVDGKYKDLGTNVLNINISQIEKYYLCPFRYFCSSILKLKDTQKFELNNREYGLLVHHVLEKAMKKYINSGYLDNTYDIVVEYLNQRFYKTYNKNMLLNISKRIALNLDHFLNETVNLSKINNFKISLVEKKVQRTFEHKGITVNINGIVDRIDKQNNKVMVIDYKTSEKKFDLNNFLYGINSQIIIYLHLLDFDNCEKHGATYISLTEHSYSDIKKTENNLRISGVSLNEYDKDIVIDKEMMGSILKYSDFLTSDMLDNIMGYKFQKCILCTKKDFNCVECFYNKICHNFIITCKIAKKVNLSNIN